MNDIDNIDAVRTRVRAHDPVSSVAAAERSLQFSPSQSGRILAALARLSSATADEIGLECGLSVVQVDRRLPELRRDGLAEVIQVGDVDLIREGFRVWRLVKKNLAAKTTES